MEQDGLCHNAIARRKSDTPSRGKRNFPFRNLYIYVRTKGNHLHLDFGILTVLLPSYFTDVALENDFLQAGVNWLIDTQQHQKTERGNGRG